jgi:hypothetical protein
MRRFVTATLEMTLSIGFVAIVVLGVVLGHDMLPGNEVAGAILGGITGLLVAIVTTGVTFVLISIDKTLKSISSRMPSGSSTVANRPRTSPRRSPQSSRSVSGKGRDKKVSELTYKSMIKYKGVDIKYNARGRALAQGRTFDSLDDAKAHIDQQD